MKKVFRYVKLTEQLLFQNYISKIRTNKREASGWYTTPNTARQSVTKTGTFLQNIRVENTNMTSRGPMVTYSIQYYKGGQTQKHPGRWTITKPNYLVSESLNPRFQKE